MSSRLLKPATALVLALFALSTPAMADKPAGGPAWTVGSKWRFTITDRGGKPVQVVAFRVTDEPARSCLGGDWRRLSRIDGYYDNTSEPAWQLRDNELTVLLASDLCDAYDRIEAHPVGAAFDGKHSLFGIEGSDELGSAHVERLR